MSIETTLIAKAAAGIGGLLGGSLLMALYRPKNVFDALIRAGISMACGVVGSTPLLLYFEYDKLDWELNLAAGSVIGFFAWTILSVIARSFVKVDDQKADALDVIHMIKRGNASYVYDQSTDTYKRVNE